MNNFYNILKGYKIINIKLSTNNISLKIVLYLMIFIIIFISTSKIVFSKELNKNINKLNSPEEELAIKYCDAIDKNIFNGLNKENLLKYEYFFSTLNVPKRKESKKFFKSFSLNVNKKCNYILTEMEKIEINSYIKKFLN